MATCKTCGCGISGFSVCSDPWHLLQAGYTMKDGVVTPPTAPVGEPAAMPPEMPLAEQIARLAHRGQVDKAGNPYIQHVERVVARVKGDHYAETVAWLHDVIEDTMFTEAMVASFVDDADILDAVDALTRDKDFQTYEEYIEGVATSGNPLALKVKLADLADHLENPGCPDTLRPRYEAAMTLLDPLWRRTDRKEPAR